MATSVLGLNLFFPPTQSHPNGMLDPSGYGAFGVFMGALAGVVIVICHLGTRRLVPQLPTLPKESTSDAEPRFFSGLIALASTFRLFSFRIVFAASLVTMIASGMTQTLTFYVGTYFFDLSPAQISVVALAMVTALVPASMLAPWLSRRFDKPKTLIGGIAVLASFEVAPVLLRLAGLFPENGSPLLLPSLFGLLVVSNGGLIVYTIIVDSMIADIVDEYELTTGLRQEGVFFSARSFAQKATFGVGSFAAGLGLDAIAFPRQAEAGGVPQDSIIQLGLLAGPCIFLLYLVSIGIFALYRIDRQKHAAILEELSKRRT